MNPVDMEEVFRPNLRFRLRRFRLSSSSNTKRKSKRKRKTKKQMQKKKQKQDGHDEHIDRISGLPEGLIHHILSFLDIYDVIGTSLLSRRWRHLWRTTPVLDFGCFNSMYDSEDHRDPTSIIGTALKLYEGRKVRRFSFELSDTVPDSHLDSWVRFVTKHDVEELNMGFDNGLDYIFMYEMPDYILECEALRVLKLEHCNLDLLRCNNFRLLTEVRLQYVTVYQLDLCGSPLLEILIMDHCLDCIAIYAPSQKLRYLEITDYGNYDDLTVYAPYLLLIRLIGYFKMFYDFKDLSSIESAILEHNYIDDRSPASKKAESQFLMELLKSLSNAKTLKLSPSAIEILYYCEWNGMKPLPLSATCLKLEIELKYYALHVVTFLLMSCPCLETLGITISIAYGTDENISLESNISLELFELVLSTNLRLETLLIHLHYFPEKSGKSEMEIMLIKSLLKCCKVLNKMVISFKKAPLKPELLLDLTTKLLAFPRASKNAEIHISS